MKFLKDILNLKANLNFKIILILKVQFKIFSKSRLLIDINELKNYFLIAFKK